MLGTNTPPDKVEEVDRLKLQTTPSDPSNYIYWGILILVVFSVALIRVRLLQIPLERDEGEFAYMGQLILRGYSPYALAYSLKLPGIFYIYALIMGILGHSIESIHVGLLIVNIITTILILLLGRMIYDEYTGMIASASFAIMSVSPSVLGVFGHATHFVMLFVMAGLFTMLKVIEGNRHAAYYTLCGLFFGIAFTMKQHAIFFIPFSAACIIRTGLKQNLPLRILIARTAFFAIGVTLPFMMICLYLSLNGLFDKFWFWTFTYAREYVSEITIKAAWSHFIFSTKGMMSAFLLLAVLAALGLLFTIFCERTSDARFFILAFLLASFLAICPGFYFRGHYYILTLPPMALLVGKSIRQIAIYLSRFKLRTFSWMIPPLIFVSAVSYTVFSERVFFFFETPAKVSRTIYGNSPFPESIVVAKYIEENTLPKDRILVLGSEPQIYFYSRRLSATGHIYMYGLMENQIYARKMQQEMIKEIETADPKFIVSVTTPTSWVIAPHSDTTIFKWAHDFIARHFEMVGVADIVSPNYTVYVWGDDAKRYSPRSESTVFVLKKKH